MEQSKRIAQRARQVTELDTNGGNVGSVAKQHYSAPSVGMVNNNVVKEDA